MNLKIKKLHPDAVIPKYATVGSAGFDLVAVEDVFIEPGETKKVPLGLAFEIPVGYVLLVCMRSGIALKTKLRQPNAVGVIDSDYRGEVSMMFDNITNGFVNPLRILGIDGKTIFERNEDIEPVSYPEGAYWIKKGERVAQGMLQQVSDAWFFEVDELTETERGTGGFGSTGVKPNA